MWAKTLEAFPCGRHKSWIPPSKRKKIFTPPSKKKKTKKNKLEGKISFCRKTHVQKEEKKNLSFYYFFLFLTGFGSLCTWSWIMFLDVERINPALKNRGERNNSSSNDITTSKANRQPLTNQSLVKYSTSCIFLLCYHIVIKAPSLIIFLLTWNLQQSLFSRHCRLPAVGLACRVELSPMWIGFNFLRWRVR